MTATIQIQGKTEVVTSAKITVGAAPGLQITEEEALQARLPMLETPHAAEPHSNLKTVSRKVKDMARKAVQDDEAGLTEKFPE